MRILIPLLLILFFTGCNSSDERSNSETNTPETDSNTLPVTDPVSVGIDVENRVPTGLRTGTKAPGFAGRDQNNDPFDLYSVLQERPVVLLFYRGKWCPVCNRYMSNLNDSVQFIQNKGVQIVAVTPELKKNTREFAENTSTKFPILSDPGNNIMKAFDVSFTVTDDYQERILSSLNADIAENNGQHEAVLPVPATYVIDQSGEITYVHFDIDYKHRASVKEILAAIESL